METINLLYKMLTEAPTLLLLYVREYGDLSLLIASILVICYSVYTRLRYGQFKSLSDSDYLHDSLTNGFFELMIICSSLALCINGDYAGLLFILVAIFSNFKKSKFNYVMHMIGAFGGFILSAAWFFLWGMWWWFLAMLIINTIVYFPTKESKSQLAIIELVNVGLLVLGIYVHNNYI